MIAMDFFRQHCFEVCKVGENRGHMRGNDAYDYIVRSPQGKEVAVNVKYGYSAMQVTPKNLKRLNAIGLPVAFLFITPDRQFYWAEVQKFE